MLAAFLTTILYSFSGVMATRSTKILPSLEANFWRLLLATLFLALFAHTFGAGLSGPAFPWFLLSGFVGFGIGDVALYLAYPKLGSRLVIMIVHCGAAPLAALLEWTWLGKPMAGAEMVASGLILSGVAMALFPARNDADHPARRSGFRAGIAFASVAASCQGIGAVLSRHANEVNKLAGVHVDGVTAAYQRILAGIALSAVTFLWVRRDLWLGPSGAAGGENRLRRAAPWVLANAIAGPTLGVSCFQWALVQRGTGVVLPIVALTPLIIIPFSMWMEGERPSRRSLLGGVIAVAGAVLHAALH